jgi:hypothetical protein
MAACEASNPLQDTAADHVGAWTGHSGGPVGHENLGLEGGWPGWVGERENSEPDEPDPD